jgi:hypothetical protein
VTTSDAIPGSLIAFYNVFSVQLESETFSNIGAFTGEHFAMYSPIALVPLWDIATSGIPTEKKFLDNYSNNREADYFDTMVGNSLITSSAGLSFAIKSSTFTNIWNLDTGALFASTSFSAIIISFISFTGTFTIESSSFSNMYGFLNSETYGFYTTLASNSYSDTFGIQSPLFNSYSSTNSFLSVVFTSVSFDNIIGQMTVAS